jgi:hypothetical protein
LPLASLVDHGVLRLRQYLKVPTAGPDARADVFHGNVLECRRLLDELDLLRALDDFDLVDPVGRVHERAPVEMLL